jgi:hypothetical protein
MKLDYIISILPAIVAFMYITVGFCYIFKKDHAWALVWLSYAVANLALIMIGNRGN